MNTNSEIENRLKEACNQGLIEPRTENNQYLKVSYKGLGDPISDKWNIKIYTSGKIVCVDFDVLYKLLQNASFKIDTTKKVIQIDDAGVGFVLCGVMVGVTDGEALKTDVVDASFFQDPAYLRGEYLTEYTRKGYSLVINDFKATPHTHRVEICSGYINKPLRSLLREKGFDVCVVEIKGKLQDKLEDLFKEYVYKTLGKDLAYDPKELSSKKDIAIKYYEALEWGRKNAPRMIKTGWPSLKDSALNI